MDDGTQPNDEGEIPYLQRKTTFPLELYRSLPLKLHTTEPDLGFDLTWRCPEDDCSYEVNFVCLPDHLLSWMAKEDYAFLARGVWDREDLDFQRILCDIYEYHFYQHLTFKGIKRLAKRRHEGDYVSGEPRLETVELSGPGQATPDLFDVRTSIYVQCNTFLMTTLQYHFAWAKHCPRYRQAPRV